MTRLQQAIRDDVNRSSALKRMLLNWGINGLPTPVKDGNDYYRITLVGEATFHVTVLNRAC